jgi:hypothetical protein
LNFVQRGLFFRRRVRDIETFQFRALFLLLEVFSFNLSSLLEFDVCPFQRVHKLVLAGMGLLVNKQVHPYNFEVKLLKKVVFQLHSDPSFNNFCLLLIPIFKDFFTKIVNMRYILVLVHRRRLIKVLIWNFEITFIFLLYVIYANSRFRSGKEPSFGLGLSWGQIVIFFFSTLFDLSHHPVLFVNYLRNHLILFFVG